MNQAANSSLRICLVFLSLLSLSACHPSQPPAAVARRPWLDPADFSGQKAYEQVEKFVALGPRPAGSDAAAIAAGYLVTQLVTAGFQDSEVEINEFMDDTPAGPMRFRNVVARLPGTGANLVIIASHYDTKSGIGDAFVGANDGGSSTGVLLALAEILCHASRPEATIMLAFLDGEECQINYGPADGLHGSRRLAQDLQKQGLTRNIRAFILLDMIGDRDLTVTLPGNCTPELAALALQASREEGARRNFGLYPSAMLDDHVPFLEAGVPAVDIIDFEYGSAPGLNDLWHTTDDTLDKLSPESLQIIGRVVIRMLNSLAE